MTREHDPWSRHPAEPVPIGRIGPSCSTELAEVPIIGGSADATFRSEASSFHPEATLFPPRNSFSTSKKCGNVFAQQAGSLIVSHGLPSPRRS